MTEHIFPQAPATSSLQRVNSIAQVTALTHWSIRQDRLDWPVWQEDLQRDPKTFWGKTWGGSQYMSKSFFPLVQWAAP